LGGGTGGRTERKVERKKVEKMKVEKKKKAAC